MPKKMTAWFPCKLKDKKLPTRVGLYPVRLKPGAFSIISVGSTPETRWWDGFRWRVTKHSPSESHVNFVGFYEWQGFMKEQFRS